MKKENPAKLVRSEKHFKQNKQDKKQTKKQPGPDLHWLAHRLAEGYSNRGKAPPQLLQDGNGRNK